MDGLDEFEKALAAEKAQREEERRHGKHRHSHHRHGDREDHGGGERVRGGKERDRDRSRDRHRHRHRHTDRDTQGRHRHPSHDDGHRHKRRRHFGDDGHGDYKHAKTMDPRLDLPCRDDEKQPSEDAVESKPSAPLVRDAWMTSPSGIDVDYVQRPSRRPKTPPAEPQRVVHRRKLNARLHAPQPAATGRPTVDYAFADEGSSWRMTKLRAVYRSAEDSDRPVDDVAVERYGSLEAFDEAREERQELDRRAVYGRGYRQRDGPTGELYRERGRAAEEPAAPEQGTLVPEDPTPSLDPTALNRLRAQMKAKLRRAPDAARLEAQYDAAAAAHAPPPPVVVGAMDSRQLAGARGEVQAVDSRRGRARGAVEERADMSVADMVREERRTRGQPGGEAARLAERIARDGAFVDSLDYLDANAERLARRIHKSDAALKQAAVAGLERAARALDACPLCPHEDAGRPPVTPVVALATRVFLTLAPRPEVTPGGAVVAPLAHRASLLDCDDDEWEELRNFMKSLTRTFHAQGRDVVFYEDAAAAPRRHAALVAAPVPYDQGALAPAFFREALLAAAGDWAQHRPLIDTAARAARDGLARGAAFRRCLPRELPYFHVWFSLDGGLGHVVEDPARWPRADGFARAVVASMAGTEPHVARRPAWWARGEGEKARVDEFRKGWRAHDWTRLLADG